MTTRILSAALLLAFAAAASAQVPEPELIERTARAVETYPRYTVFDHVAASIDGGVVTLTGKVTMPIKKDELGKRIEGIAGAGNVRNEIDVLPVSIGDERIRQRTSRAIYGNAAFWGYAARPNPPIHIIVEHGRVTLTGVVSTEVDRALAQSLATGLGEFSVTNALRVERAGR